MIVLRLPSARAKAEGAQDAEQSRSVLRARAKTVFVSVTRVRKESSQNHAQAPTDLINRILYSRKLGRQTKNEEGNRRALRDLRRQIADLK